MERITLIRKQRSSLLLLYSITCSSAVDLVDCFSFIQFFFHFPFFSFKDSRLSIWLFFHFFLNLWHATPWLRIEALLLSKFSFKMIKKKKRVSASFRWQQLKLQREQGEPSVEIHARNITSYIIGGCMLKNSVNASEIR